MRFQGAKSLGWAGYESIKLFEWLPPLASYAVTTLFVRYVTQLEAEGSVVFAGLVNVVGRMVWLLVRNNVKKRT